MLPQPLTAEAAEIKAPSFLTKVAFEAAAGFGERAVPQDGAQGRVSKVDDTGGQRGSEGVGQCRLHHGRLLESSGSLQKVPGLRPPHRES